MDNEKSEFDVTDLGAASVETRGLPGAANEAMGQRKPTGISDID